MDECQFHALHHVGPDGRHWCPTGYMICDECEKVITIDLADANMLCNLWGEYPYTVSDTSESLQFEV